MNGTGEPAPPAAGKRPLDDVMLAMDVVDTLRHRDSLVKHELAAEDRDEQLIERLRALYAAQGIDVPDDILAEGVAALHEDRFAYQPPPPSFQVRLAQLYVTRARWGWWLAGIAGLMLIVIVGYWLLVSAPQQRRLRELPAQLNTLSRSIKEIAVSSEATELTDRLTSSGQSALSQGDTETAYRAIGQLQELQTDLEQEYELRIVQQGSTGIWRIPDVNEQARNYYIIVEAVTSEGTRLTLPITNEEDGQVYEVGRWGLRVDESTFRQVEADKRDDGIIQDRCFGRKRRGELDPEYLMPTTGDAITSW